MYKSPSPINDCIICKTPFSVPTERQPDPREYGTDGKLALLGCESGRVIRYC
jgi:hypothetical protein